MFPACTVDRGSPRAAAISLGALPPGDYADELHEHELGFDSDPKITKDVGTVIRASGGFYVR